MTCNLNHLYYNLRLTAGWLFPKIYPMIKKNRLLILVALLTGVSLFSVYQYGSTLYEKQKILNSLTHIKSEVSNLRQERKRLAEQLDENIHLTRSLAENNQLLQSSVEHKQKELDRLRKELVSMQASMESLQSDLKKLEIENLALSQEKVKIAEEKSLLETRFNSIRELKKAISALRKRGRKVRMTMKPKKDYLVPNQGNRGYIIKDGKPTLGAKVMIKVIPVQ